MNRKYLFIIGGGIILLISFLIYFYCSEEVLQPLNSSSLQQPASRFLKGVAPLLPSQLPKFLQSDEFIENNVEYKPLVSLKDYSMIYDFSRGSDFKDFACEATSEKGNEYSIIHNDKFNGPYKDMRLVKLRMSPDGKHVAFVQRNDNENNEQYGRYRVIFNNQVSRYYNKVKALSFSPDSRHFVYAIKENDNWFMVFDGKRSEPFQSISFSYDRDQYDRSQPKNIEYNDVVFSPDSKIFAYFVRKDGISYLIINDRKIEISVDDCPFGNGQAIKFSPDSKRIAFVILCPREGQHEFYVQKENDKKGPYTAIKNLTFTSDGKHLVYVAQKEGKEFIVFDEKESAEYDYIFGPKLSFDGQHFAYVAKEKDNLYYIILDDKKIWTLDESFLSFIKLHISPSNPFFSWYEGLIPVFSPDSQKFAYPIMQNNKWFLVTNDGKKEISLDDNSDKAIDKILSVTFSPDSQHLAYIVSQYNEDFIVLDDQKFGPYNDLVHFGLDEKLMVFSPNSQHLAYIVAEGDAWRFDRIYYLVIDGKKSEAYERIFDITFSPDSNKIIYLAKKNDQIIKVEKDFKEF